MPYKNPKDRREAALRYSRKPDRRVKQAARRKEPWYKEYMRPIREINHMKRYGLTPARYREMLKEQDNKCAICRSDKPNNGSGDKHFDVDHNHKTGKVRGLLCRRCNLLAGQLERNTELLEKVKRYLAFHLEFDPE